MAHRTYTTEGIVLNTNLAGEANSRVLIFAKDLGLIKTVAQNTKSPKSKLKHGLQDYSFGIFSLVKGQTGWRITNVIPEGNFYFDLKNEKEKLRVVKDIFTLIKKMVIGEEENQELFNMVFSGLSYLAESQLEKQDVYNLEILLVLRMMRNLGYLQNIDSIEKFLETTNWSFETLKVIEKSQKSFVKEINRAIKDSDL